jgi:hypothetical protein
MAHEATLFFLHPLHDELAQYIDEVLDDIPYVLRHMDMVLPDGTGFFHNLEPSS